GNSIHYVLDADGRVIDALPGLYGPQAFLRKLRDAEDLARRAAEASEPDRASLVRQQHKEWADATLAMWQSDLQQVGAAAAQPASKVTAAVVQAARADKSDKPPSAVKAAPRAMGKMMVERRLVVAVAPDPEAMAAA